MSSDFKALSCNGCNSGPHSSISKAFPKPMDPTLDESEFSAFYCSSCERPLLKISERDFQDDNVGYECACGKRMSIYTPGYEVAVLDSNAPLLDGEAVKTVTWFHSTGRKDWLDAATSGESVPYVHLGSLTAAMERADNLHFSNRHSVNPVYLWEVTVATDAVVAEDILMDEDNWCKYVTDCTRNHVGGDVQRYLNTREGAGSISLMIDPRMLVSTKVAEITSEDCNAVLDRLQVA